MQHAKSYVDRELPQERCNVEIKALNGDIFKLELDKFQPQSVHLKNPDHAMQKEISDYFSSNSPDCNGFLNLVKKCDSSLKKGLILVLDQNSGPYLDAYLTGRAELITCTEVVLDYDVSYQMKIQTEDVEKFTTSKIFLCKSPFLVSEEGAL